MGCFASRNDLLVRTSDGRNVVLQEPLEYVCDCGSRVRAPIGATSDGASTPRALWQLVPPFGEYWLAAVLHDAAYRGTLEVQQADGSWAPADFTQAEADDLIGQAMASLGVNEEERSAIYRALKEFGGKAFREDRASTGQAT